VAREAARPPAVSARWQRNRATSAVVGDGTGIARSIDTRTRGHMSRDPP